jgi:hypothetical protein
VLEIMGSQHSLRIKSWHVAITLATAFFTVSIRAQTGAPDPHPDPKDALGWFQRASDQMNLRGLDKVPFHMKVAFTALPGLELLDKKKKPQIVTGDGVYEETWLAPHHWRREVTLGGYHAIEVESQAGQKMQASSDYEPSRVLMLLDALLYPLHRDRTSPDPDLAHPRWKIEHKTAGNLPFVLISAVVDEDTEPKPSFVFLPSGQLVQSYEDGLAASWQDDVTFAGHVVPRQLMIQAGGRKLLTADIRAQAAGQVDPAIFELPGETAEPGMTLRPFHFFDDVRRPGLGGECRFLDDTNSPITPMVYREILDRHGVPQEMELLDARNLEDKAHSRGIATLFDCERRQKMRPATIDKSPAQLMIRWYLRPAFGHK